MRKVADRIPVKSKMSNEVLTDPEVVISRLEIDYVRYLKILELFITDLDKGIANTRNLIADGDILPALSRLDAMKGSCLTFGAYKFRNSVEKIDQLNESSLDSLEVALDELRETFDTLKIEIGEQGLTSEMTNLDSQTVPLGEGVQSIARAKILLIDDKPIIVRQIRENLVSNSWVVKSLKGPSEAMEYTLQNKVDLLIVSLSLPENGAFSLIRFLRSNARTRGVPVFELSIKTAVDEQRKAQESGFNTIVTKPINFVELKSNIARTLHIDMTSKYYRIEGEYFIINIPHGDLKDIHDMQKILATKLAEVVEDGYGKVIIDALEVKEYHMETFELIGEALEECENLAVPGALAGSSQVTKTCQEFEDYKKWTVHQNLEEAKQSLSAQPIAATPV